MVLVQQDDWLNERKTKPQLVQYILVAAAKSLSAYFEKQKVTLAITVAELDGERKRSANCEPIDSPEEVGGAGERNRTSNQRFTKPLLCH